MCTSRRKVSYLVGVVLLPNTFICRTFNGGVLIGTQKTHYDLDDVLLLKAKSLTVIKS